MPTISCLDCKAAIEVNVSDEGGEVVCDKCLCRVFVPLGTTPPKPKSAEEYFTEMASQTCRNIFAINIGVAANSTIRISEIALCDALLIEKYQRLLAVAESKFVEKSAGIGFWGSPGWVISGMLINGIMQDMANNKEFSEGLTILKEAKLIEERIRGSRKFFNVSCIANIENPNYKAWISRDGNDFYIKDLDKFILVKTIDNHEIHINTDYIQTYSTDSIE